MALIKWCYGIVRVYWKSIQQSPALVSIEDTFYHELTVSEDSNHDGAFLTKAWRCRTYVDHWNQQLIRIHRITLRKKKQTNKTNKMSKHTNTHLPSHTCSNRLPTLPKRREWILYQLKWNCKTLHRTSVDWAVSNQLMAFNFIYFKDCCNYDEKETFPFRSTISIDRWVWKWFFFSFDFVYLKIKIKEKIK